jgi:ribosomal protein S18 acetylase RimI-like enzyme
MISTVLLFIGLRYSERRRVSLRAAEDVLLLEAGIEDLGEASVLLVTSFFGERNPSFLAVAAHREHRRLREHHGGDRHIQLIARSPQGDAVGYVDCDGRPSKSPGRPRPYVSDLAVREDYRRRGLATCLVQKCESIARAWSYDRVFLKVEASNDAARKMYGELGYEVVSTDGAPSKQICTIKKSLL